MEEHTKPPFRAKEKVARILGKAKVGPEGGGESARQNDMMQTHHSRFILYLMTTVRVLSTTEMQRLHAVIVPVCIIWKFDTLLCLMNISSLEISEAMARWHPRCVLEALSWCYSLLIAIFT